MKKIKLAFVIFFCGLGLSVFGQSPVDLSEFEYLSDGVIYVTATDSIMGQVKYNELSSGKVWLIVDGKKDQKFQAKEVVGFKLNNPAKEFISVRSDGADRSMLFYENTSPKNSRLYLLKYFEAEGSALGTKVEGGKAQGQWNTTIYSPVSKSILPNGNKKLAAALKDCPELSNKIAKKEKGYSVGMIALPGAAAEFNERIVREYNACQ